MLNECNFEVINQTVEDNQQYTRSAIRRNINQGITREKTIIVDNVSQ